MPSAHRRGTQIATVAVARKLLARSFHIRARLRGRVPRVATVHAALCELEAAGLAVRQAGSAGETPRWSAAEAPHDDTLAGLKLRGPHDLRHTFSTWLEDAGIPARVIDELMGHASGRPGGELQQRGSLVGLRYRWTTPEMEARVVAAIEQRLAVALKIIEVVPDGS
jgi:integrase